VIAFWPKAVPLRLRVFFRGTFLLLALATVALALTELREEKTLAYRNYARLFERHAAQLTAILRHPAGQLALTNPAPEGARPPPQRPIVLPFAGIDFDDRVKARNAVEMAGCLVPYAGDAELCVAVGNNPFVGGFIYAVGRLVTGPLETHTPGERDLSRAHRIRVEVTMRGATYRWLAPLEATGSARAAISGRLTGFAEDDAGRLAARPNREFRGWLWQESACLDGRPAAGRDCPRRSFYSLRLPVPLFDDAFRRESRPEWPPPDLPEVHVHLTVLGPGDALPLFDSDLPTRRAPFALQDLKAQLIPGERLTIRRRDVNRDLAVIVPDEPAAPVPPLPVRALIARLPVTGTPARLESREVVATRLGDYELLLSADVRHADQDLALVATRVGLFVAAMLAAILATWLALEVRIVRRITALTARAATVRASVQGRSVEPPSFADLEGRDELGLLAQVFGGLLRRVTEDAAREQIRAEQERNLWQAVGHEILSPLQSLKALHSRAGDPSARYIERMQEAVRLLYGGGAPPDAFASRTLNVATLDVAAFLGHVAANAEAAGLRDVVLEPHQGPLVVRGDEYSLEDVVTHILTNADRYRAPGTAIRIQLERLDGGAEVRIRNTGPGIEPGLLERIFEYGVTGDGGPGHRGQGLFVARTYMAKMGGTIRARNTDEGVEFVLALALA
jgi:signal transduction histidine kinase